VVEPRFLKRGLGSLGKDRRQDVHFERNHPNRSAVRAAMPECCRWHVQMLYYAPKRRGVLPNLRFNELIDNSSWETHGHDLGKVATTDISVTGHNAVAIVFSPPMRLMRLVPLLSTPNTSKNTPTGK